MPARKRLVASLGDSLIVIAIGGLLSLVAPISATASLAGCAVLYYGVTLATIGCTPVTWVIEAYLDSRHPAVRRAARRPRPTQVLSRSEH
jgi:hypothetical protein